MREQAAEGEGQRQIIENDRKSCAAGMGKTTREWVSGSYRGRRQGQVSSVNSGLC